MRADPAARIRTPGRFRLGRAAATAMIAALLAGATVAAGRAQAPAPAPAMPDTSRLAAPADTLHAPVAHRFPGELLRWKPGTAAGRDTTRAPLRPAARAPRSRSARIDLEGARKEGMIDAPEALRARRALLAMPLPTFGSLSGSLALPDGGGAVRVAGGNEAPGAAAADATDRAPVILPSVGILPDLATILADPGGSDFELLDFTALDFPVEPGRFDGPGDALARALPRSPADPLVQARGRLPSQFRTTLLYRKGSGGELSTGVRFIAPTLLQGVFGSFARHDVGRTDAIFSGLSSRYHVEAALPHVLSRAVALDARLLQRSIEGPAGGSRAEQERAELAIRAQGIFGQRSETWSVTLGRTKRTDVLPPGLGRERWEIPSLVAAGEVAWGDSSGGSVYAAGRAGTTRISHWEDATADLASRRGEARISAGVRRRLGAGGVGADGAYDVRETERGAWDARVSGWIEAPHANGRLDLESAHERPSWIDRLSTSRTLVIPTQSQILTLLRSGDPGLTARRLTGAVGFGSWEATPWLTLSCSGSARRVVHDFGWDLERSEGPGTIDVLDVARQRGSGWLSHAALGGDLHAGPVTGRVLTWLRFGSATLSPREGEPARRALDADLSGRVVLFGGDLPVRGGLAAHATGPRGGLVREPAQITWDGTLRFDLGAAGVFVEMRDLFDRIVQSSLLDLESGRPVPLPGRALRFGVVWNLVD